MFGFEFRDDKTTHLKLKQLWILISEKNDESSTDLQFILNLNYYFSRMGDRFKSLE